MIKLLLIALIFPLWLSSAKHKISSKSKITNYSLHECSMSRKYNILQMNPPVPGRGVILLTFNGYKPSNPAIGYSNLSSSELSQNQQILVQKGVVDRFKDWDIVVTTDDSLFYTFPKTHRIRVVITKDTLSEISMNWMVILPTGLSLYNTLYFGDTTASIISIPNHMGTDSKGNHLPHPIEYNLVITIAHEVGHQLGLAHQAEWGEDMEIVSNYSRGNDTIAPIMGIGYWAKEAFWIKGTNELGQYQDDTAIISKTFRKLCGPIKTRK